MTRNIRRSGRATFWLVSITALGLLLFGVMFYFLGPLEDEKAPLTFRLQTGDLRVSVLEQGTLESSNNTEIKCQIRGYSTVTYVIPSGTYVNQGDVLVRLDTKRLEDQIGKFTTDAHVARATYERTKADVASAEIAIDAYLKGEYLNRRKALVQAQAIANNALKEAQRSLGEAQRLFRSGYVSNFELEAADFNVQFARLESEIRERAIHVLDKYTKKMRLETLNGNLKGLKSKLKADEAGLRLDESRRDRAIAERKYCEIIAERDGLVIYPSAAEWKSSPDIVEGATVRKDQILLLMPDLSKMQVKVGIHESSVDSIRPQMPVEITLPDAGEVIQGHVKSVANVARPAGWWTGNMVKYDTVVQLQDSSKLKPGMSVEVEILVKQLKDQILVPVAAVVEIQSETFCWVKSNGSFQRRRFDAGDSNDVFVVAKSGLDPGDEVVLDPLNVIDENPSMILPAEEYSNGPMEDESTRKKSAALAIAQGGVDG